MHNSTVFLYTRWHEVVCHPVTGNFRETSLPLAKFTPAG